MSSNNHQAPIPDAPGQPPKNTSARALVNPPQPDRLIRIHTVCELSGLGKTSVYSTPGFPKRVVLSRRAVGWRLSEVQAWIESRSTVGALISASS